MDEPIRVCVDRPGPDGLTPFAGAPIGKQWRRGQTLKIRFLDGEPSVQARVQAYALEWCRYANIKFDFGTDPAAEIRITFLQPGSWSVVGIDALAVAPDEATMNFGWLNPSTPDDEVRRVVLHEFGHALSLIHEHQNPMEGIPWNKPAVYRYYQGKPNFWTQEQVDSNLFQTYDKDMTYFSEFDPKSIMLYPVAREFTLDGFSVGLNSELSEKDKTFIAALYPPPPPRARPSP